MVVIAVFVVIIDHFYPRIHRSMKWPRTLQMTRYFPRVENAMVSVRFIAPDSGNGPPSEKVIWRVARLRVVAQFRAR